MSPQTILKGAKEDHGQGQGLLIQDLKKKNWFRIRTLWLRMKHNTKD
jgi:hypothetical protein